MLRIDCWLLFCLLVIGGSAVAEERRLLLYNIGSPASKEEIAILDIDVRPDGKGLPAGGGNARDGLSIYQQKCRVCHGEGGQGGPYDTLVGRQAGNTFSFSGPEAPTPTIGNYWPYAPTLFDYIRRAMPYTAAGSLSDDQVYAVTAYLLYANEVIPETLEINATSLPEVIMPSLQRFVPDNRMSTTVVQ